jgi:hypothetical protein
MALVIHVNDIAKNINRICDERMCGTVIRYRDDKGLVDYDRAFDGLSDEVLRLLDLGTAYYCGLRDLAEQEIALENAALDAEYGEPMGMATFARRLWDPTAIN